MLRKNATEPSEAHLDRLGTVIGRCGARHVLVLTVPGDLPERRLDDLLPSAVVEHQEVDRLGEVPARAAPAVGLLAGREPPQVESRWIAVVDLAPEVIALPEPVEPPVEVAEHGERHGP